MSKGFLWFAQNNGDTDYVELSIKLAESIKSMNRENKVCVITDENSKFEHKAVDFVRVLKQDSSAEHKVKWANEHKAFYLTPFTHTIKLESDMLWTLIGGGIIYGNMIWCSVSTVEITRTWL